MGNSLGSSLVFLAFGTLASASGLWSIIKFSDPYNAGLIVHIAFYLLLFLTIAGLTSIVLIFLRYRFIKSVLRNQLDVSLRQGCLVAVLFTSTLLLQVNGLLVWWVAITLVLFVIVLESFFNT